MDLARQSLAITLVFALLWAALWLLRRRGILGSRVNSADRSLLQSRGKISLTAQHSVHLVRISDRNLVLAVHPAGITLLCEGAGLANESHRRPGS
jgi:flagellar biosynthetic protein FliO